MLILGVVTLLCCLAGFAVVFAVDYRFTHTLKTSPMAWRVLTGTSILFIILGVLL